jgi:Triose-phosphate Transporter family
MSPCLGLAHVQHASNASTEATTLRHLASYANMCVSLAYASNHNADTHTTQQRGYMALSCTQAVSHSVGHIYKRVSALLSTIIVFNAYISQRHMVGSVIATVGAVLYATIVRRYQQQIYKQKDK